MSATMQYVCTYQEKWSRALNAAKTDRQTHNPENVWERSASLAMSGGSRLPRVVALWGKTSKAEGTTWGKLSEVWLREWADMTDSWPACGYEAAQLATFLQDTPAWLSPFILSDPHPKVTRYESCSGHSDITAIATLAFNPDPHLIFSLIFSPMHFTYFVCLTQKITPWGWVFFPVLFAVVFPVLRIVLGISQMTKYMFVEWMNEWGWDGRSDKIRKGLMVGSQVGMFSFRHWYWIHLHNSLSSKDQQSRECDCLIWWSKRRQKKMYSFTVFWFYLFWNSILLIQTL